MAYQLQFAEVWPHWEALARGALYTLELTAVSTLAGVAVGTLGAAARSSRNAAARAIAGAYVELIRNTPFIIQLFFVFFGLPSLGVRLGPEVASVAAMVLNLGGYASEIVRAGLEATPRGQLEAAASLAMNRWQIFTRVVLPPALERVWPALVSQIIIVMLGSAVCSQISTEEVSYAANLINSRTFRSFEAYIVVTTIYLALAVAVRRFLYWLGPRWLFRC